MEKLFQVSILSSKGSIYQGEISSLIAPAEFGYLGVLANHAPLITKLTPGKIILKEASGEVNTIYSKEQGFLEVFQNQATILLE